MSFKTKLTLGEEHEKLVIEKLKGIINLSKNEDNKGVDLLMPCGQGLEVKFDIASNKYGNFYFEISCNGKLSGIFKEEEVRVKYWVHSNGSELYIIHLSVLRSFIEKKLLELNKNKTLSSKGIRLIQNGGDGGRSKGVLIPIPIFDKLALYKIII